MANPGSTEENQIAASRELNVSLNSEAAMDEFLNGLNLYRKPVAKDGSCLFRAVSEHVYNTQEKHLDVRQECITFMKEKKDHFSAFVIGSYEHHLFGLQNPKEWAGQVEIVALSLLYHCDFLIYQEVNQPPSNVTNHGFDKKIMLCFSNGNHYDIVYSNEFKQDAALIQSILYELIYKTVLPECQKRDEMKEHANDSETTDVGDNNKNTWVDVKSKTSKGKKEVDASLNANDSMALWEIERSLDVSVYRNVALEVWEQSKLEQTQADRAIAMKLQFKIGEFCLALVGESSAKEYLKAQIKDIIDDKYLVYVPKLDGTYYVFLECLKPLLAKPEKTEQLTYDKLPGYYRKSEEPQKDFQYPKKRQQKGRGYRDEEGRPKRGDGRYDQRNEKGEGKFENRNDMAPGGLQQRRDRRDRRSGQGGARHDRGDERAKNDRGDDRARHDRGDERARHDRGDERAKHDRGDDRTKHDRGDERARHDRGDDRARHDRGDDRARHDRGDDRARHDRGDDRARHDRGDDRARHDRGDDRAKYDRGEEKARHDRGDDRARHDRGDRRDYDRKGRFSDKGGKKTDSQIKMRNEEQKPPVAKKGEEVPKEKDEKVEETSKAVLKDVPVTSVASPRTSEVEKEKTAKQDESPAAFWQRMRKPEPQPLPKSDGSKTSPSTEANSSNAAKLENSKETDKGARLNSPLPERKDANSGLIDEQKLETKQSNIAAAINEKPNLKTEAKIAENATKQAPGKQNVKSNPAKHNQQGTKPVQNGAEKSHEPSGKPTISNHLMRPPSENEDVKENIKGSASRKQPEVNQHAAVPSVPDKDDNIMNDTATNQDNDSEQPKVMNHISNEVTSGEEHAPQAPSVAVNDVHENIATGEEITGLENGYADYQEFEYTNEAERYFEPPSEVHDIPYIESQMEAVQISEEFSVPTHALSVASEVFVPAASKTEIAGEPKFEARNEQQRIRILTKGNEDKFISARDISPEPESRKAQPKKVSFGNVVEFSDVSLKSTDQHDIQEEDQGIVSNPYSVSNGVLEHDDNVVYENAGYNHATGVPFVPMIMPGMVHGNEQMQIPQKYSIDPEGRDLPQHVPTLQYFFNLGLQFFMMQHQPPAFINMQIPQVPQMQATATQMHAHSYPVQSSSHVQAPYTFGQPIDEIPQIKADQQDDYQTGSTIANDPYDVTMAQKQQSYLQQRNFHAQNHQTNASQYEQPPRMRRGRGRGSTFGPSMPVNRYDIAYNKNSQPQQPRIEKRNYNVNMVTQIQQPPLSYPR